MRVLFVHLKRTSFWIILTIANLSIPSHQAMQAIAS